MIIISFMVVQGADGVCNLLENLENDLDYTMALCGKYGKL